MLYYFFDGSPSSGFGQFVCHEFLLTSTGQWWNRLLPVLFLNYGEAGTTFKIFALLWPKYWADALALVADVRDRF